MISCVDVLVVAAMAEEAEAVAAFCSDLTEVVHPFAAMGEGTSGEVRVRMGVMEGSDATTRTIALVQTGIGTAAASAVASWAISEFGPGSYVSVGSCGGLASDISVGTVVVGSRYSYSIADATAFGYAPGQVPGAPQFFESAANAERAHSIAQRIDHAGLEVREGLMISGDAFVTADIAEPMRVKFPEALSADMETTAHAHTAHLWNIPFVAIRAVSDLCSPRAGEEFHIGLDEAAEASARALRAALPLL